MVTKLAAWFNAGGPYMWAILAVCAAACAVVVERALFYYIICGRRGLKHVHELSVAINGGKDEEVKNLVQRGNAPLTVLLRAATDGYLKKQPFAEIQEVVEETAIQQLPRLPQRLNYLSLFANVATLLGLLGTIAGLQLSFSSLASVEAVKKAAMLASGISQAMITTAFGLIIAIPCMILYTFLSNKQSRVMKELDEATVRFLNFLRKKCAG